jgi:hypothetical protein
MSEALKNCTSYSNHLPHRLVHMILSTVFDQGLAKRLQEDGGGYQGRTVRRSDYWRGHEAARRCARCPRLNTTLHSLTSTVSHSESFVGTALRRLVPTRTSRKQTEGRDTRQPRHDHPHYHAHPPTRSRSHGVQNEPRRPRWCFLRRYWRSWRASARTARGVSTLSIRFSYARSAFSSSHTPQIIELPLLNPELFQRVGITPPKGVLLYGPPGTGKTLLARAVAATLETNFLKVVSSAIVDKYIGESARVVREMFGYARDHEPCVIFMDEIDAIGGRRFSEGTSADREIQRTLMEVLSRPCP